MWTSRLSMFSTLIAQPSVAPSSPPACAISQHEQVMSNEQLETLRRQISVYFTICHQLVEMHKASVSQQSAFAGSALGQHLSYDQVLGTQRISSRQRWTPSQSQLHILERLFYEGNGAPNKQRIKEIASELSQHGHISETNVYNWFQNLKARAKRKHQQVMHRDKAFEAETDPGPPQEKKNRLDGSCDNSGSNKQANVYGQSSSGTAGSDQDQSTTANRDLYSEIDVTSLASYGRGAALEGEYADNDESGHSVIMIHEKPRRVFSGIIDAQNTLDETAVLFDSGAFIYSTDEGGPTLAPLLA